MRRSLLDSTSPPPIRSIAKSSPCSRNHEPTRPRKLLLHRAQIVRLAGQVAQKGYTLIPLSLYFRDGKAKVELGVCKGKVERDKREDVRRRDADREASRAVGRPS